MTEDAVQPSPADLDAADSALRREAGELLEDTGLLRLLEGYGKPHVVGSYSLELMVWRDLDLYLEADDLTAPAFFELGRRIVSALDPAKMSFRNTRLAPTEGLPDGLYWGVYQNDQREDAWKIDIWAVDSPECRRLLEFRDDLARKLAPEARPIILRIKSQLWRDAGCRRSFGAVDIYRAVLDRGLSDVAEFREYLGSKGAATGAPPKR